MHSTPATSSKFFQWLLYSTITVLAMAALVNSVAGSTIYEEHKNWIWITGYDPVNLYLYTLGLTGLFNWIDILFIVMLLTGALLFSRRQYDDSGLLRFGLSIICIQSIAGLFHAVGYIQWIKRLRASGEIPESQFANINTWLASLPVFFDVIIILVTLFLVRKLNEALILPGIDDHAGSNHKKSWFIVSKNTRAIHYLVDSAIILMALFPLGKGVMMMLGKAGFRSTLDRLDLSLLYIGGMIIYYTFFELLFRSTPAKFLSGTYVVDESGQHIARYNRVMARIIGRFIPLDQFSFVFGRGWHDSISQTTVSRLTPSSFRYGLNMCWFGLFIIVLAVPTILDKINEKKKDRIESDLRKLARQSDRDLRIKHLGKGYLLNVQNKRDYQDRFLLLVSDERGDSLEITVYHPDQKQSGKGLMSGWAPDNRPPFMVRKNGFLYFSDHDVAIYNEALGKNEYEVDNIHVAGFPLISPVFSTGSKRKDGVYENNRSMRLSGQSCTITKLITLEGDAIWQNKLPQTIALDTTLSETGFQLYYHSAKKERPVKASMTVEGPDGKSYEYLLSLAGSSMALVLRE